MFCFKEEQDDDDMLLDLNGVRDTIWAGGCLMMAVALSEFMTTFSKDWVAVAERFGRRSPRGDFRRKIEIRHPPCGSVLMCGISSRTSLCEGSFIP